LPGTDSEVDSTWTVADAARAVGRKCFCAGHVEREMRLRLESWIEAYGRTLGGKGVSAFVLRPSCLRCLDRAMLVPRSREASSHPVLRRAKETYLRMCIRLWHRVCCKDSGGCNN
jgi:hypothetical protein